jgi:hypothetical protein
MSRELFPQWTKKFIPLVGLLIAGGPVYVITLAYFAESAETVRIGYRPDQPVAYSHALHAGELGIDCRYCHDTVDRAAFAAVPAAATCMACHTDILPGSKALAPIRDAAVGKEPIRWIKVHDLPDYVYFNHSAHVVRGVGCESCHGRVDRMETVEQTKALTMSWCLDCHRDPTQHLREPNQVTVMGLAPPTGDHAAELRARVNPPTNCSTCHR